MVSIIFISITIGNESTFPCWIILNSFYSFLLATSMASSQDCGFFNSTLKHKIVLNPLLKQSFFIISNGIHGFKDLHNSSHNDQNLYMHFPIGSPSFCILSYISYHTFSRLSFTNSSTKAHLSLLKFNGMGGPTLCKSSS